MTITRTADGVARTAVVPVHDREGTGGATVRAALDDDGLWPTSYAVTEVDEAAAEAIAVLVRRAVG